MSVSIRVIDGVFGKPAVGMPVRFGRDIDGQWVERSREQTDDRGQVPMAADSLTGGEMYQIELDLDGYFSSLAIAPFYSAMSIKLWIQDLDQLHSISYFVTPYSCFIDVTRSAETNEL